VSSAYLRGLLILAGLGAVRAFAAPPGASRPAELLQVGVPDQAEGRAVIAQFRQAGPPRPYYLDFDLIRLPRRGAEQTYHGRLWGGRDDAGATMRIEIDPGGPAERRFLLHNGTQASVWESERSNGALSEPKRVELFTPLVPGLTVTPFDLQMPYLYWPDAKLLSVTRVRGRLAHVFIFRPPAGAKLPAEVTGVRAFLDTQYHAPVQTELLGRGDEVLKTFSLLDLKKVGEEWLPEEIDIRDERTRDKGRFNVKAAALNLDLLPAVFLPADLDQPIQPPSEQSRTRF
jgi:hypothetical protein